MQDPANTANPQRIVIQGMDDRTITVRIDGQVHEVLRRLENLEQLLQEQQAQSFQVADKIYNIQSISEANFSFALERGLGSKILPEELVDNLITDENRWVESLKQALLRQNVAVGSRPMDVFSHYGWLIETFLQKLETPIGKKQNLRRLSFLAEAFQSSLRYLCYLQVIQLVQAQPAKVLPAVKAFLCMSGADYLDFDYLDLLIVATDQLDQVAEGGFVAQLSEIAEELREPETELFGAVVFMEDQRKRLRRGIQAPENDQLAQLLQEYLTALVYWLRRLSFLASYRLVSIKDINLSYRLGTQKNFVHEYGELHGVYDQLFSETSGEEEYRRLMREGVFTYNKSVLLLRGSNVELGLQQIADPASYPSLSPFIIDQSVFATKPTQTPEIYYFTGYDAKKWQYQFALYKNELPLDDRPVKSNKYLTVRAQNNNQPKLDELFEQMQSLFKSLRK